MLGRAGPGNGCAWPSPIAAMPRRRPSAPPAGPAPSDGGWWTDAPEGCSTTATGGREPAAAAACCSSDVTVRGLVHAVLLLAVVACVVFEIEAVGSVMAGVIGSELRFEAVEKGVGVVDFFFTGSPGAVADLFLDGTSESTGATAFFLAMER